MSEKTVNHKPRPLMSVSPRLYRYITEELENQYRIHSYDLQLHAIQQEDGIQVLLLFGDNFDHQKKQYFSQEELEDNQALSTFIEEVGEECKKVMIDDYFNRMAP
ncbi:hypothetical protein GWK91_00050 [Virgibacillus sp. MSP4-1]|uniref:hypothetical protein n=1 Tax=Virgibacillus sp. MSP4-1 TaxID=2700081 RepID=UPI0003A9E18E|nr:hypothetical protein [Virgibacillus sp. MSP4-1]QHS21446.1 hypothetical protein GWK91_00050 [Virgibacillus sp. MSP4-1]